MENLTPLSLKSKPTYISEHQLLLDLERAQLVFRDALAKHRYVATTLTMNARLGFSSDDLVARKAETKRLVADAKTIVEDLIRDRDLLYPKEPPPLIDSPTSPIASVTTLPNVHKTKKVKLNNKE